MKIALLSNVNVDLIIRNLNNYYNVYNSYGFGTWLQELLDKNSGLYAYNPELIFLLIDAKELFRGKETFDECLNEIKQIENILEVVLIENTEKLIFVSNIDYPEDNIYPYKKLSYNKIVEYEWLKMLKKLCDKYINCYVLDIKSLIEQNGQKSFYSSKLWYVGGIPFSLKGIKLISQHINQIILAYQGKRKKCLLVDLDNTLWGGVIGEDGIYGIELSEFKEGGRYKDFQRLIKQIKDTGIILGIVSKNNKDDVIEVFTKHEHMVLKEEDFVITKINWDNKIDNIKQISVELNIGLDSIVYIDDNEVECEQIRHFLPDVTVPVFPKDTSALPEFINEVYKKYFFTLNVTDEDKNKSLMYKQNIERQRMLNVVNNLEEFLYSLQTEIKVWKATNNDVERIAQLTQKTNQFNLTGHRYTIEEIKDMIKKENVEVWIGSVKDKFGDNGKVIVWIIYFNDDIAELDTFLMSCRVMGRFLEEQIIDFIEKKVYMKGIKKLRSYYIPTSKNLPVKDLFLKLGYSITNINEDGKVTYEIELPTNNIRKSFATLIDSEF
ncbi:HAD-IIIC family phosphatase [Caloramator sp. CAR-1]|uniref:HAD-IIIC family phosphatase n=1 Tax=Caloramator sp. CAR-1 TaxID=3062777 RepID=UPI0026E1FF5E|nr:HAD-IIIC family phosphatase [Caloramator sp. CAR-1]MDO6355393.1 HAD-IIIC family phosphatase [Caloramator sp. CAR-1]